MNVPLLPGSKITRILRGKSATAITITIIVNCICSNARMESLAHLVLITVGRAEQRVNSDLTAP